MLYPRQKIYGYSFYRQLKNIFLNKKYDSVDFIKKFFELNEEYNLNFVFKARIGLFHILSFLFKNNKTKNKIILSSFTVFDMINMVLLSGFEPIFIDHYKNSSQINIDQLKEKINEFNDEVGAVLLTHYNVNNSELSEISNICKQNKIILIEDCAISIGSKFDNDYVGKFGDYSIFSFGFYKFINVLSGGMIFSKNKDFYNFVIEKEKNWEEIKIYNLYKLIIKSFFVRLVSSKIIFKLIFPIIKFAYKNDITLIKKLLTNDPKPHKKENFPSEYKFRLSQTQINDIIFQFKNLKYLRKLREINYRAYSEGIKNEKIIFFHNKQNLLNENAYLNFPIIVKDKNKFISYMLDNEIDISPQFYRSVNELSFLSKYSKTTKLIQDSVSNLVTLPTYSGINKYYIRKIIETINRYR
jgi:dTDP-4-amino-4,6-dideoxygalactose transaminase